MIGSKVSEEIAAYTRAGFPLFPCRGSKAKPKDRKKPAVEWRETRLNQYSPKELGDIYGVNLGPTHYVLDIDPKREASGENQMMDLIKRFKIPTPLDTFIVESGSGGRHVYMSCPPGRNYKFFVPEFGAIEVKSHGRYVIGAGSLYSSDGTRYRVLRGSPDKLMQAPEELLEWCEQEQRSGGDENEDDSPANQDRFIQYCLNAPPSIQGKGGDVTTLKVALVGRDYGLSEHICYALMSEYYNAQRCSPRWSEADLKEKVANAYMYAQNSKGFDSLLFDASELGTNGKEGSGSDIRKGKRLDKRERLSPSDWDFKRINGELTNILLPTFKNAVNHFLIDDGEVEGKPNPLKDMIGYNLMSEKIVFRHKAPWHFEFVPDWTKQDTVQLKYYLTKHMGFSISTDTCEEAMTVAAMDNQWHPLRDQFELLKWDGEERLTKWLHTYAGAIDCDYTDAVSRITLISAIARVYDPGCKVDTMTVLEGLQGIGKSTLVEILGGEYSSTIQLHVSSDTDARRTISRMIGKWLIEVPEMTHTKKQDIEAIKAFLTTRIDNVVLPYARYSKDIPRQSVFIGTFNPTADGAYLNDATGNRRYFPVLVARLKLKKLREDRDQLIAEAIAAYKSGEAWHMKDREVRKMAKVEQDLRTAKEIIAEPILEFLESDEYNKEKLTMTFIATEILGVAMSRLDRHTTVRIGKAMREIGYEYVKAGRGSSAREWVKI